MTPIIAAVLGSKTDLVKKLVTRGAIVNCYKVLGYVCTRVHVLMGTNINPALLCHQRPSSSVVRVSD